VISIAINAEEVNFLVITDLRAMLMVIINRFISVEIVLKLLIQKNLLEISVPPPSREN